jgi:hypothetical protein
MPLTISQKLKIKTGDILLPIDAPANFEATLKPLPGGAFVDSTAKKFSQVHWFVKNKADIDRQLKNVLVKVKGNVICWIYYPKGSSGIQTDLTRDKGWDALLKHKNLQRLTLISFDETWSAFGFREQTEADKTKEAKPKEREIFEYIDAATKTIRLPPEFETALKENKVAANYFASLSFSNKKEYVEWIVTAKQEKTKQERVAGAIERLEKKWKNPRNM